ncbi:MAG: hypothetical protein K6G15_04125 [Desulfovibrio sp.]|nr:hypothetical protein [Desulfovibrio sp.]
MEIEFTKAADEGQFPRIYGMDAVLKNFKGCPHLEITLFRHGATAEELKALYGKNLVGAPDADVPAEVLSGATEEGGLRFLLENFTREEVEQFLPYLQERYGHLVEKLIVAPVEIPVPLGTGPLGLLPASKNAGFICFDKAENYPLPFAVRAYFDFSLQEELSANHA